MRLSVLTMIKNEAKRLPEWVYFHKHVHDVDRFVFYLDNPEDNTKNVLDDLKSKYNIEYFYTRDDRPYINLKNEWAGSRQTDSFTRGSMYLKNISDWIAVFDVDEFIVPNKNKKLKEILCKLDGDRLYIPTYCFQPPFDVEKSMIEQCFCRWSDEERVANGQGNSGKSVFKTSAYNNEVVNTHYGPVEINFFRQPYKELIPCINSKDFKLQHFRYSLKYCDKSHEIFDNSIVKYFKDKT